MLSIAQQMLQESRTKIELLRMQIIKVSQSRNGESEAGDGTSCCTHTSFADVHCSCSLSCQVRR